MPYDSRAYRVLIASPSDVEEEREIMVKVIQEWNDLHSYNRQVVLLPLRWETHTAPEYGTRPQEVINRAIVDQCDLLVGVFWARIGTPTGEADSGTLEEIERVAKAGKPIMLYFSEVRADLYTVNHEQFAQLRAFKERIQKTGLIESFKSQIEFRDKFSRQLEIKVRDLQKMDNRNLPQPLSLTLTSDGINHESELTRELEFLKLDNLADPEDKQLVGKKSEIIEKLKEIKKQAGSVRVGIIISNHGTIGFRNLYVTVLIKSSVPDAKVDDQPRATFFLSLMSLNRANAALPQSRKNLLDTEDAGAPLLRGPGEWAFEFEWDALQPQRVRSTGKPLMFSSEKDCTFEIQAKVYADSLPEPAILNARLITTVKTRQLGPKELTMLAQTVGEVMDDARRLNQAIISGNEVVAEKAEFEK